ncbi:hypothetical protein L3Q82_014195 [Scortum barcoo]|uniref:Uncharacterized protein n=1 Tax=Scortum barcoo TaxID=214431 RepID=A0ACB8VW62_9TELE|nr:hypothetical protein L3Q82_014195 [Scortum barcoo]
MLKDYEQNQVTKGSPAGVQHALGTGLTYCLQCEPSSCSGCTETKPPLALDPSMHTRGAPPQNTTRDSVECLLQIHKAHVDWLGILGIELVQCSMTGTKKLHCSSRIRGYGLSAKFSSPVPWCRPSFGEAEKCDPPVVGTHSPVPLFKKRDHHPRFATPEALSPTSMQCLQRRVSQDSPTTSRDLRYSGRISSTPGATEEFAKLPQ